MASRTRAGTRHSGRSREIFSLASQDAGLEPGSLNTDPTSDDVSPIRDESGVHKQAHNKQLARVAGLPPARSEQRLNPQ
jgi:hypothetical protein